MPQGFEVLKLSGVSRRGNPIFIVLSKACLLNNLVMEFKIDTKSTFSVITPIAANLDANLTGLLTEECQKLQQNGSNNFIVDLQHCIKAEQSAINELVKMHEGFYSAEQSLVFTGMNDAIITALKKDEMDLLLNIAPKMEEAIDIVSMEILERDLLKEE